MSAASRLVSTPFGLRAGSMSSYRRRSTLRGARPASQSFEITDVAFRIPPVPYWEVAKKAPKTPLKVIKAVDEEYKLTKPTAMTVITVTLWDRLSRLNSTAMTL